MLAGLAWHAGDADRIVAEIEASRVLSGQADPAVATRAQVLLAMAAFLAGPDFVRSRMHSIFHAHDREFRVVTWRTGLRMIEAHLAPVARRVLTAAALTYVVGALIAAYQLALLLISSRR